MAAGTNPAAPDAPWTRVGTRLAVNLASGPTGDQAIVVAPTGVDFKGTTQKIRVLRFSLTFSVATDAKFTDTTPADISGVYQVAAGGNWSGEPTGGYECGAGKGLNVNNSVASRITGDIWYELTS